MAKNGAVTKKTESNYALVNQGKDVNLPQILAENLGGDTLTPFDLDRVKIPTGGGTSWEIHTLTGEKSVKEITGVIVFQKSARVYWKDDFTGQTDPPDCSSEDGVNGFGDPGGFCAVCPLSKFGSSADGRGQSCKQLRQLFVITPDNLIPVLISLPPTSVVSARKYLLRLAGGGIAYYEISTSFTLEKVKNATGIEHSRVVLSVDRELTPTEKEIFRNTSAMLKPQLEQIRVDDYKDNN